MTYNFHWGETVRITLFISILLFVYGCGKNTAEQTAEAIDVALSHLSKYECEKALKVLHEVGMQSDNGIYLQVLASAYACQAGFNEIRFVSDLESIDTSSGSAIFKSLARINTSEESEADSPGYTSIKTGINVILNSTAGVPSQESRTAKFGPRKAGDLGVEALILSLVNFGKFLRYYGNSNESGTKGSLGGNTCFINYTDPRAQQIVSGSTTGSCNSYDDGHPDLNPATADGRRRMCEGLVLLTNSLDILNNIDFSESSTLEVLNDVAAQVNQFKTIAIGAGLGDIIEMRSQKTCETYAGGASQLLDLEYFYALTFEQGFL